MKTVRRWVRRVTPLAGVLCVAAITAGAAAHADWGRTAEGIFGEAMTMIDPFSLEVITIPEMLSIPEDEGSPGAMEIHLDQTIRIPDRPLVRSVFKPRP